MLRGQFLKDRHAYITAQEPSIFHCHHYNTYLQAVIEDAKNYLNVYPILIESAQEISYSQFKFHFSQNDFSTNHRKVIVEDYFQFCGFGLIDLSTATATGGTVTVASDHYGIGWKSKFGLRSKELPGVSFFTLGYILGALEAIYDLKNGELTGQQSHCLAKGDPCSQFIIRPQEDKTTLGNSPKEGQFQTGNVLPATCGQIDAIGIRDAVVNMPLEGSTSDGLINAFGVLLTRMYANYYCLISYKFLKLFEKQLVVDGIQLASQLLTEAGHICAFNTFGGIMQSAEWNALIKPMIQSKEDWVHGIVSVVNAFGWGIWEIIELIPNEKLVIKITSGYEANSFLQCYNHSTVPISFLATGGVAGIMNLIYHSPLTEKPISLSEKNYRTLFKNQKCFKATQTACRSLGHRFDIFEAQLHKP